MDELPVLDVAILTVVLDRQTGLVEVNHEGMNYLEAIGVLTVAMNQVQETPFELEYGNDLDED